MSLKQRANQLKTDIPALFLALQKKDTPVFAKMLAALTVCYALSPIDLIPDCIPILGYLDDLILLPSLIALTIRLIPSEVLDPCRAESETIWKDGKPKKWFYALPILLIWGIIIYAIIF